MDVIDLAPDKRGVWVYSRKNVPSQAPSQKLEIIAVLAVVIPTNPVLDLIVARSSWPIIVLSVILYSAVTASMARAILYLLWRFAIRCTADFSFGPGFLLCWIAKPKNHATLRQHRASEFRFARGGCRACNAGSAFAVCAAVLYKPPKCAVKVAKQTDRPMAIARPSITAPVPARTQAAANALRGLLLLLIRP